MKKNIKKLLSTAIFFLVIGSFAKTSQANVTIIDGLLPIHESFVGGAYLTFAGKFGGEVNKKELDAHNEVAVSGCAAGSKIFQFTLYVTQKGKTTSFQTRSSNLTTEMVGHLKNLSVGDSFEFKRIKANLPKKGGVIDVVGKKFFVV